MNIGIKSCIQLNVLHSALSQAEQWGWAALELIPHSVYQQPGLQYLVLLLNILPLVALIEPFVC